MPLVLSHSSEVQATSYAKQSPKFKPTRIRTATGAVSGSSRGALSFSMTSRMTHKSRRNILLELRARLNEREHVRTYRSVCELQRIRDRERVTGLVTPYHPICA